jgi:hypothetical protein
MQSEFLTERSFWVQLENSFKGAESGVWDGHWVGTEALKRNKGGVR